MTELSIEEEVFTLAFYQKLTPQEKGALLKRSFSDLTLPFLDWADQVRVTKKKEQGYLQFKKTFDSEKEKDRIKQANIHWVTIFEPEYPHLLRNIYAAPLLLFYKGEIDLLQKTSIGVVGARACTSYGIQVLQTFLPDLIQEGYVIASGLAKGIDAHAHKLAIHNKGKTIGVIGTGLDSYYPSENKALQASIAKDHLLISEYPLGVGPKRHHFPFRNRIIAGISKGLIVVEAKERSGSLITAHQALDSGREVFVVPGSIFQSNSKGCNKLIQLGAKAVLEANDILEEFIY